MESKTHRIDIKYGSKLLPPFNLRIGYGYTPPVSTYKPAIVTNSVSTNIAKPAAPIVQNPPTNTVFGKIINSGTIKGTSAESETTNLNIFDKISNLIRQFLKWIGLI
jgi:hypothetical protein